MSRTTQCHSFSVLCHHAVDDNTIATVGGVKVRLGRATEGAAWIMAYLGLCCSKLDEADALELARLAVCGQAHRGDCTALSERLRELLAHFLLAQVFVKALHKYSGAIAV